MRKMWEALVIHLKDAQRRFKEGLILHPWRYIAGFFLLIALGVVLYWAIFTNASPEWTGFGEWSKNIGTNTIYQRTKTLWDWMELLLVPIALAIAI